MKTEPKKLSELTISELKTYYELAQARFEQVVKMYKANMNGLRQPGDERKLNQLKHIVDTLVFEIERRLNEDIDITK